MKKHIIRWLVLFICASPAMADSPSEEQIERLLRLTGFTSSLEQTKLKMVKNTEKYADYSIENFADIIPMLTKEELQRSVLAEKESLIRKTDEDFDLTSFTREYARLLAANLSAEDVEQVIAFYETEAAQRLVQLDLELEDEPRMQALREAHREKIQALSEEDYEILWQKIELLRQGGKN